MGSPGDDDLINEEGTGNPEQSTIDGLKKRLNIFTHMLSVLIPLSVILFIIVIFEGAGVLRMSPHIPDNSTDYCLEKIEVVAAESDGLIQIYREPETQPQRRSNLAQIKRESQGESNGQPVYKFIMTNRHGVEVTLSSLGAAVTSFRVPDKNGIFANIVLGFNSLNEYERDENPDLGAVIGPVAGRVRDLTYVLDGLSKRLRRPRNPDHGGYKLFNKAIWEGEIKDGAGRVVFKLAQPNQPGAPSYTAVYELTAQNDLHFTVRATARQATPIALAHNLVFNLRGSSETLMGQRIQVEADCLFTSDEQNYPTGEIKTIHGEMGYDLRRPQLINEVLTYIPDTQYDHTWLLRGSTGVKQAATINDFTTGRQIIISTNQPALHLKTSRDNRGISLQPRAFPEALSRSVSFQDIFLRPGSLYLYKASYKFANID